MSEPKTQLTGGRCPEKPYCPSSIPPKLSSLNPTDKIRLAAELDGVFDFKDGRTIEFIRYDAEDTGFFMRCAFTDGSVRPCYTGKVKDYPTSYDAIIPLIQKQDRHTKLKVEDQIFDLGCVYDATPSQLLDALLVATGKATM